MRQAPSNTEQDVIFHVASTGQGVEILLRRADAVEAKYRLMLTPARARYLARQLVSAAELETPTTPERLHTLHLDDAGVVVTGAPDFEGDDAP